MYSCTQWKSVTFSHRKLSEQLAYDPAGIKSANPGAMQMQCSALHAGSQPEIEPLQNVQQMRKHHAAVACGDDASANHIM